MDDISTVTALHNSPMDDIPSVMELHDGARRPIGSWE
jgi:hypothetical protein